MGLKERAGCADFFLFITRKTASTAFFLFHLLHEKQWAGRSCFFLENNIKAYPIIREVRVIHRLTKGRSLMGNDICSGVYILIFSPPM